MKPSGAPKWEAIGRIKEFIQRTLPNRAYDDPKYLALLERYRNANRNIPIGAYVELGVGVCRENEMLTHLMVKDAGIVSRVVYA